MKLGKKTLIVIIPLLAILLLGGVELVRVTAATSKNVIVKGVSVDKIEIGGMTKQEALQAIDNHVSELQKKQVGIAVDSKETLITLGELGYEEKEVDYIEEAFNIGKKGNLIHRYKEIKEVEHNGKQFELEFTIDDAKVEEFIKSATKECDVPAQNATMQRENGAFIYTEHVIGKKVDLAKTKEALDEAIRKVAQDIDVKDVAVVDAVIEEDIPKYTVDVLKKCDTIIGSFDTDFSGSSSSRVGNVSNAAKLINNTVLYPGDVFSAYEKMQPFTTQNGYFSAPSYVNGLVEDSIGGGVCQVSSTLYNAVLNAELEVVERAPHSMTVHYVPLAQDAAIAGTYKDLKFKNNLEVPILIESYTRGNRIYFNIYGCETRDLSTRTIKYESVMISKKEPPADVIKKDDTQPETYKKVTQSAHIGYVAELYKVVYENGVEVSRTRVNRSSYNASPNYITVGTKKPEEPEVTEDPEEVENPSEDDNKPVDENKPSEDDNKPSNDNKPSADEKPNSSNDANEVNKPQKPQKPDKNDKDDATDDKNPADKEDKPSGDSEENEDSANSQNVDDDDEE